MPAPPVAPGSGQPGGPGGPNSGSGGPGSGGSGNSGPGSGGGQGRKRRRRRRGGSQNPDQDNANRSPQADGTDSAQGRGQGQGGQGQGGQGKKGRSRRKKPQSPVSVVAGDFDPIELDADELETRRGQYKDGKALGRYQMLAHVDGDTTHISVLEGKSLVEHYVSKPTDDVTQIHGNIYVGRVENVLPGMEAAFVDIGTPKNAVLYRSDIVWDPDDLAGVDTPADPRIEDVLKKGQLLLVQVTKNPIGHKGARLTQEVSIPGRFVVFVPNSETVGISKRLPDNERKRLRKVLSKARPNGHGLIVRTAAENVTDNEIRRDVQHLASQWEKISAMAEGRQKPQLIYREPPMAVRMDWILA